MSDLEGGNIRVETLVSEDDAERIWNRLARDYFPNYAITAWTQEVQVVPGSAPQPDCDSTCFR